MRSSKTLSPFADSDIVVGSTTGVTRDPDTGRDVWIRRGERHRATDAIVQQFPQLFHLDGTAPPSGIDVGA